MTRRRIRPAPTLACLLTATGVLHFAVPQQFDAIVPRALPGPSRRWTHLSGVAELAVAAAVATPRTRRRGGVAAALLFVAVFPANVQMALDWRRRTLPQQALAWGRLPLQLPLIAWALRASRDRT
ncbi:MAG: DoxX family protein [Pseudonocardiaceae bacterium]